MNIAIIPARGGSKRIPRKNIRSFCGKPIISYSIECALQSKLFDRVMVSTDDEEIKQVAEACGAEVPFIRSEAAANDTATLQAVIKEVLASYQEIGQSFSYCCCLLPTAPLIKSDMIITGYKTLLEDQETDMVVPIAPFSYPLQRSLRLQEGFIKMTYPEYVNTPSNGLEHFYHDIGQFYWVRPEFILSNPPGLLLGRCKPLVVSPVDIQDIDTEEDWEIAEFKYKYFNRSV